MPENQNTETNVQQEQEVDYVAAIKELKDNSVPREQYAKLKEENAKLLKSLISGETVEGVPASNKTSISELRKQLYSGETELTNLEYVAKSLELREQLIANGEPDPLIPIGHRIAPTNEDIEAANRVAQILKECVEYADGDSSIFTSEEQRRMIDVAPMIKKTRK